MPGKLPSSRLGKEKEEPRLDLDSLKSLFVFLKRCGPFSRFYACVYTAAMLAGNLGRCTEFGRSGLTKSWLRKNGSVDDCCQRFWVDCNICLAVRF